MYMDGIQIEKEADMNTPQTFHLLDDTVGMHAFIYASKPFLPLWPLSLYFKFTFTH